MATPKSTALSSNQMLHNELTEQAPISSRPIWETPQLKKCDVAQHTLKVSWNTEAHSFSGLS